MRGVDRRRASRWAHLQDQDFQYSGEDGVRDLRSTCLRWLMAHGIVGATEKLVSRPLAKKVVEMVGGWESTRLIQYSAHSFRLGGWCYSVPIRGQRGQRRIFLHSDRHSDDPLTTPTQIIHNLCRIPPVLRHMEVPVAVTSRLHAQTTPTPGATRPSRDMGRWA